MRKRIFEIIELSNGDDRLSSVYDVLMMCTIVISLIPLAFKDINALFLTIDYVTAGIFVLDYLLRFITADYKLGAVQKSKKKRTIIRGQLFVIYPFTPMAVIDLLAVLYLLGYRKPYDYGLRRHIPGFYYWACRDYAFIICRDCYSGTASRHNNGWIYGRD